VPLGKALNGIALPTFEWLDWVVTGDNSTRKTEKVPSLSPGRGTLTNK